MPKERRFHRVLDSTPLKVLILTRDGHEAAQAMMDGQRRRFDQRRIPWAHLRHDLMMQQATVKALQDGVIEDYRTPIDLKERGNRDGEKEPDGVWFLTDGHLKIAVEVELSGKWADRLDRMIRGMVESMEQYDLFMVVTDKISLAERYSEAMRPGAEYGLWKRRGKRWERVATKNVPAELRERVLWEVIS
ncbi:MAG: hypothetical protein LC667_14730 [Thioalkalivibrio sp.]|nr:hypothetical protein [Thioalkalivibrio sp.]